MYLFGNIVPQDLQASVVSQLVALSSVTLVSKLHNILVGRKLASQSTVRKLLHIITGFLYTLTWPLYSEHPSARFLASLTPLVYAVRLIPTLLGWLPKDSLLHIMTRNNTTAELGRGPLAYALVHVVLTWLFWRESGAALAGIAVLCAGDGLAEVVGVTWGRNKWPHNTRKSIEGSLAMFFGGFLGATGLVWLFISLGYFTWGANTVGILLLASGTATLIESLPLDHLLVDNWSVAISAAAVCWLMGV